MAASRLRALGVALVLAFGLLIGFRQLGAPEMYSAHGVYRAQTEAILEGRLALTEAPEGLAHDLAWTPSGVQQVWGLGVPLWQTPFQAGARALGTTFPDRIAMGLWLALMIFFVWRAFRPRDGEPWWTGVGCVMLTALLPAIVTMLRGRLGVYEEAAAYSYGAAMMLLAGLVSLIRFPSGNRYVLLLLAAGLAAFMRPTVGVYAVVTAVLATGIYVRAHGPRVLPYVVLGLAVFIAGNGALYMTNKLRFGNGMEFGHHLNLQGLPANIAATRFSYPFQQATLPEASLELGGSLFDRPELSADRTFFKPDMHRGQSERVRWREYYFTTFSWPFVPVLLAGIVLAIRRRRSAPSDPVDHWLGAWAVIALVPLVAFYLWAPFLSSRYQLDFAPAFAALLVIAWRRFSAWVSARGKGAVAFGILVVLWGTTIATSKTRNRIPADPVDLAAADAATAKLTDPSTLLRELPASYDLSDPSWIATPGNERPRGLYLNAIGWDPETGRVAPATHFFVEDPHFIELEVENVDPTVSARNAEIQVAIGLEHLAVASVHATESGGARFRFEPTRPLAGLRVAFVMFAPTEQITRPQANLVLRRVRWRD